MYGINELLLLQHYSQNLRHAERHAERQWWIKEAETEDKPRRRSVRQRWSSFASLFLF